MSNLRSSRPWPSAAAAGWIGSVKAPLLDPVQRERALAGDGSFLLVGERFQRLLQLLRHSGELGVRMRIIGRPDDAIGPAQGRVGREGQHRLVRVKADPALPAEVL